MVAASVSTSSHSGSTMAAAATRCRYKTGKCSNARSSKRNGEPHQLCVFHRDKANKIQRKFDRTKRQVARAHKLSGRPSQNGRPSSSPFASLSAQDVDMYSEPDASRFSTDSESSSRSSSDDSDSSAALAQLWTDLPESAYTNVMGEPLACATDSRLSYEEIDFLCSAMLD